MDLWELDAQLKRGVFLKPEYVNVAGDLAAGALLSQIMYWYRPSKNGQSKVRVLRDDRYWIAKTQAAWCDECGVTEKQFRRVVRKLQDDGYIQRAVMKFGGETMTHISLNEGPLLAALMQALSDKPAT